MYATVVRFRFATPPDAARIRQIDRETVDLLAQQPGFRGYYGLRVGEAEAVVVSLWDDRTSAERATERIAPETQRVVGALLAAPPERQFGEVVLSRAPGGA
jgi:heme-degrading monooxygenase HmoA